MKAKVEKYTTIEKHKDQFGRCFYVLKLTIDNQSFVVGRDFEERKTATWMKKMLIKALTKIVEAE